LTNVLISDSFALHPHLDNQDAATWLAGRIPQMGWAPRDVFTSSLSFELNQATSAVRWLDLTALQGLLATVDTAAVEFSQKDEGEITAFYRSPNQDLTLTGESHHDAAFVDIKSSFVATALTERFDQLSNNEIYTLLR
jgi:hypothetical protein